jgi:hypothetical protein
MSNQFPTMRSKTLFPFGICIALAICLGADLSAHAQATRTWVSGVGDDVNPGSRTAPCQTFAGVQSKTAIGGEVDVLDPGSFGAVTITKALVIDGKGPVAAIMAGSGAAVVVNAGATNVTIRNLSLNCQSGSGTYGVQVISANEVRIENCVLWGGSANGIDWEPSNANAKLYIINCHIHDFSGSGVFAGSNSSSSVVIVNSVIEQCGAGVNTAGGTVTVTGSAVTGNNGPGLETSGAGAIRTFHNNQIFGNNPDGNFTSSLPLR